jgi:adenylate kinase
MIIAITGTPGTGKTSVSKIIQKDGFDVIDFNNVACEKNFLIGRDEKRDTNLVDIKKINDFIKKNYSGKDIVFIEGHLSHLLKCIDKVIILRCNPNLLRKNLLQKGWKESKIKENIEAEILDIILCEVVDTYSKENIFEIDVTDKSIDTVAYEIKNLIKEKFREVKKYNIGKIDWSEEILKDF